MALSLPISAKADTPPQLVIENFIGTINWVNNSGDVRLTQQDNAGRLDVKTNGSSLSIDGGISDPDGDDCKGYYGSFDISLFGDKKRNSGKFGGYKDLENYPVLNISLPKDTELVVRNAIVFTEGTPDIASADLDLTHCGKINLGNVEGALLLESRGSSDVTLGDAGEIEAELRGSGDLEAQNIGDVTYKGRGSGDVSLQQVSNVSLITSGSGDAEIEDIMGYAKLSTSGSGDIDIGSIRGDLEYEGSGSGDLSVDDIRGDGGNILDLSTSGSGDISIGDGSIAYLSIRAAGSANVNVDGIIKDADVRASGSSDIYLDTVTGDIKQRTSGSSDIHIDHKN
jgi:hypothetical protein